MSFLYTLNNKNKMLKQSSLRIPVSVEKANITASHLYFLVCLISDYVDSVKKMLESNKEYTKHLCNPLANEMIVCTMRGTDNRGSSTFIISLLLLAFNSLSTIHWKD
jgi:hypothetical protein